MVDKTSFINRLKYCKLIKSSIHSFLTTEISCCIYCEMKLKILIQRVHHNLFNSIEFLNNKNVNHCV